MTFATAHGDDTGPLPVANAGNTAVPPTTPDGAA